MFFIISYAVFFVKFNNTKRFKQTLSPNKNTGHGKPFFFLINTVDYYAVRPYVISPPCSQATKYMPHYTPPSFSRTRAI